MFHRLRLSPPGRFGNDSWMFDALGVTAGLGALVGGVGGGMRLPARGLSFGCHLAGGCQSGSVRSVSSMSVCVTSSDFVRYFSWFTRMPSSVCSTILVCCLPA